jgi:transcriptional regulator with XRE-family HTH domain
MKSSILSDKLLNARTSLRLAQTEVADYVGVAQSCYYNWENAIHTPSIKHIPKLCQILKLELNDFLPPSSVIY